MANTRLTLDAVHPLQSWLFKVGKVSKTNGSSLVWYLTWFDDLEIEVPAAVEDEMAGWEYIMSDLIWGNTWWAEDTGCFMSMATRASEARLSKPWSFKLPKMSLWNWKNQNCKKRQSKSASEFGPPAGPKITKKAKVPNLFRIFEACRRCSFRLLILTLLFHKTCYFGRFHVYDARFARVLFFIGMERRHLMVRPCVKTWNSWPYRLEHLCILTPPTGFSQQSKQEKRQL